MVSLVALCALFLGLVPTARAAVTQFGSEGEHAGQFERPRGVAVAQQTGDVFLVDQEDNRVERWGPEGEFISAWGWGVGDGVSEAFQLCGATCFPGRPGPGAGQFGRPAGVAVDNSTSLSQGDVYVADTENHRVEKFTAAGEFLLMFGAEVNAKTAGDVCTAEEAQSCQAGTPGAGAGAFSSLGQNSLAVDPKTGTVFVGDVGRVQKFSPAGVLEGQVPLSGAGTIGALAVDSVGDLYVEAEGLSGVREFDPTGKTELGEPRDATGGEPRAIAVGAADELFVLTSGERVLEYSAAGTLMLSLAEPGGHGGIAINDATQTLYVLHFTFVRVRPLPPAGPVVVEGSESAEPVAATTATLNAKVNPRGAETTYRFEYGTTTAYGGNTSLDTLAAGFEDLPVTASLTGLLPGTTYHFRVLASSAAGTTAGPDQTFTTLPPVLVDSESVSQITGESARLRAELNPHGLASTYHFEYGTTSAYELSVPVPDAAIGPENGDVAVEVEVQKLSPGTVYHYRVVATNSLGTEHGTDRTFTTQDVEGSGALPDGRAWELVSPPDKHGAALEAITEEGGLIQAAQDGSGLAYVAKGPITTNPEGNTSIEDSQLLARREKTSWVTRDITTPHENAAGLAAGALSEYRFFTADLSVGFVVPKGATPLAPQATERTPYLRDTNSTTYVPLVDAGNVPEGTKFGGTEVASEVFNGGVEFGEASNDGKHAILESAVPLTSGFTNSGETASLYDWSSGALTLLSEVPSGSGTVCGGGGPACVPNAEMGESAQLGNFGTTGRGAVSNDGTRVIFRSVGSQNPGLFVRDLERHETLKLDVPQPGARGGASNEGPVFQLATTDASRVFFTDEARLTPDSTAKESEPDLYMCTITVREGHLSCALKDLSANPNGSEAADVLGEVLGAGDSGQQVYFVANGALAAGAVHGNCTPNRRSVEASAAASCNLYTYDVATGAVSLVAVLSARDGNDWANASAQGLGLMSSRTSPNGRWLAFMSRRPLTGFDNRDAQTGEPDEEVFLYDANTATLRCVSCASTGARPVGVFDTGVFPGLLVDRPQAWGQQGLAGSIPGWTRVNLSLTGHQSRYLSDEGRLFFNSPVALVPSDGNAREDVYEFEPPGTPGCTQPSGCQALISSGKSAEESAFLDASTTGDDVFFLTAAKLVGPDTDKALDIYDAHVCTASVPCPGGAASLPDPPCGATDSCRAAPSAASTVFAAPSSASFTGPGNLTSPPGKPPAKPLTRAQRLVKALKACRSRHNRHRRTVCQRHARRSYGATSKAKRANFNRRTSR